MKKSMKKVVQNTKKGKATQKKKSKSARKTGVARVLKKGDRKAKTIGGKKGMTKKSFPSKSYAEIGAEGEQNVYDQLVQIFGVGCVYRNVYVMRKTGHLTEIDLLAIHPTGVYVVESKNYAGLVQGDGLENDWLQTKGTFTRTFYSPVKQNAGHVEALRDACMYHLGYIPPMLSLLVFPNHCELQITNLPVGLRCCRLGQMSQVLQNVFHSVSSVLGQQQLQRLSSLFYQSQRIVLPESVQKKHLKDVALARRLAKGH